MSKKHPSIGCLLSIFLANIFGIKFAVGEMNFHPATFYIFSAMLAGIAASNDVNLLIHLAVAGAVALKRFENSRHRNLQTQPIIMKTVVELSS